jgi:hypothetical protein
MWHLTELNLHKDNQLVKQTNGLQWLFVCSWFLKKLDTQRQLDIPEHSEYHGPILSYHYTVTM